MPDKNCFICKQPKEFKDLIKSARINGILQFLCYDCFKDGKSLITDLLIKVD